jgi:hypothetical protein
VIGRESEAIVLYLGRGVLSYPKRDAARLIERFGETEGLDLVAYAQGILKELFDVIPNWEKDDLGAATHRAATVVAENHPELDPDALAALRWSYSWSYK